MKETKNASLGDKSVAMKKYSKNKPGVPITKQNATLEQKVEVLKWYHANGKNQKKTADHFRAKWPELNMQQPCIYDWLKVESKIMGKWTHTGSSGTHLCKTKWICQTQHPEITEMLELWVSKAMMEKFSSQEKCFARSGFNL